MIDNEQKCQICGRRHYDEKRCIFHLERSDKDAKLFQQKLNEIFNDRSLEIYDFSQFVFPDGIIFPEKIDKKIIFNNATFQGHHTFFSITFEREADFSGATFQGTVSFRFSKFLNNVDFGKAIFKDHVDFQTVFFHGEVKFVSTVFHKEVFFSIADFKKRVLFIRATFKGKSEFFAVNFIDRVDFMFSTFEDELIINQGNKRIFSLKEVNFIDVKFFRPEKVNFIKVDLSNFGFLGTNLRKVEFVDVNWYKKSKGGRNRVYDEIISGSSEYPFMAQMYKRLRANYEENLNYAEAGDFHIGEMEMRRKGEKNFFNKCIIWAYKLISNYGESYWRPLLFWILPMLLLFPLLFMYSGIEQITSRQSPYMIHYQFNLSTISLSNAGDFIKDYLKSFVYSLSVFSLVREKLYRPINDWSHFWMVLESILSPVMIAFFLLALRRRFKR